MIYEGQKQITYNDIDANWDINLTAILKYMTEANWANGEELGIGVSQIPKTNLAFVTQRIAIKILMPPVLGDKFLLRTWPAEARRTTFVRKGVFLDLAGNKLIEWESLWVLVDMNKRKIKRPSELKADIPLYGDLGVAIATERIQLPTLENVEQVLSYTHKVDFSDLDPYQHMSNIKYGDLLTNVYRRDENRSSFMKQGTEIHFNYTNEGQIYDDILVSLYELENKILISGTTGAHAVFTAVVKHEE